MRKPLPPLPIRRQIYDLHQQGLANDAIAAATGCGRKAVARCIVRFALRQQRPGDRHPPVPEGALTVRGIAELVRVSEETVRKWIRVGKLAAHKVAGRNIVLKTDLDAFIAAGPVVKVSDAA